MPQLYVHSRMVGMMFTILTSIVLPVRVILRTCDEGRTLCLDERGANAVIHHRSVRNLSLAPIEPDTRGWLWSEVLDLWVGRWKGVFQCDATVWMRLHTLEGELVLTDGEASCQLADQEAQRAERMAAPLRALGIEPEHA